MGNPRTAAPLIFLKGKGNVAVRGGQFVRHHTFGGMNGPETQRMPKTLVCFRVYEKTAAPEKLGAAVWLHAENVLADGIDNGTRADPLIVAVTGL